MCIRDRLSDAPLRMEALLVRSLMEELRAEICRRDEALAAQLRSNMMAAPLGMLTSAQGTAAYMAVSYTHLDVYKRQV